MKKLICVLLAALCLLGCCAIPAFAAEGSFANFKKINTYSDGAFSDVDAGAWYLENVAAAYELGLMKGDDGGKFNPTGSVTLAETLTLAARLHSYYYTGAAEFSAGTPWYQVYVDYALENGLISAAYADYNAAATRSEFAAILARTLPETALPEINDVADNQIPDVKMNAVNAAEIYRLYRAGILAGNDSQGHFSPSGTIERSAVAAIVTRMAYRSLRQKFVLEESTYPELSEQARAEDDFFADAAMMGNSLVQGLQLYSKLNTMSFYCKEGIGVSSADSYVTDLCQHRYGKVYLELGINEIYMAPDAFADAYGKIVDRIGAAMPDAEIYIMAITPVTQARSVEGTFTMTRIAALNAALYALAAEKECWYLDSCTLLCDSTGYLQTSYAGWDGSPHLSGDGYAAWENLIRTYYA